LERIQALIFHFNSRVQNKSLISTNPSFLSHISKQHFLWFLYHQSRLTFTRDGVERQCCQIRKRNFDGEDHSNFRHLINEASFDQIVALNPHNQSNTSLIKWDRLTKLNWYKYNWNSEPSIVPVFSINLDFPVKLFKIPEARKRNAMGQLEWLIWLFS